MSVTVESRPISLKRTQLSIADFEAKRPNVPTHLVRKTNAGRHLLQEALEPILQRTVDAATADLPSTSPEGEKVLFNLSSNRLVTREKSEVTGKPERTAGVFDTIVVFPKPDGTYKVDVRGPQEKVHSIYVEVPPRPQRTRPWTEDPQRGVIVNGHAPSKIA